MIVAVNVDREASTSPMEVGSIASNRSITSSLKSFRASEMPISSANHGFRSLKRRNSLSLEMRRVTENPSLRKLIRDVGKREAKFIH